MYIHSSWLHYKAVKLSTRNGNAVIVTNGSCFISCH